MERALRSEYPGAIYHVMARGNQGQKIYADDGDRQLWLCTLGQARQRAGWRLLAFVLLGNHYHLLLETPKPIWSAGWSGCKAHTRLILFSRPPCRVLSALDQKPWKGEIR